LRELIGRKVASALENHVFKKMGKPGTEFFSFVYATGGNPSLRGNDGRRGIWIEDQGKTVGKCKASGGGERVFHGREEECLRSKSGVSDNELLEFRRSRDGLDGA
jgi:hypothetical protein